MENYELCNPHDRRNVLGVGSFATVKLARDKRNNRLVALKIIDKKARTTSLDRENLKNEITIHQQLEHPNIIKLFESFESDTHVYLALEYAKNGSLFSYLTKKRKLAEPEAVKFFKQCCEAMLYLHQRNIMHRDFKPENILLDESFNVKLCDFGWCTDKTTEKKFSFCGTYEYMAPEMVERRIYDETIDIWGLGILIYELLHGYSPFKGSSNQEVCQNIKKNKVVFASSISQEAKDIVLKILKTLPVERLGLDDMLKHKIFSKAVKKDPERTRFRSHSPKASEGKGRAASVNKPNFNSSITRKPNTLMNSRTNNLQNSMKGMKMTGSVPHQKSFRNARSASATAPRNQSVKAKTLIPGFANKSTALNKSGGLPQKNSLKQTPSSGKIGLVKSLYENSARPLITSPRPPLAPKTNTINNTMSSTTFTTRAKSPNVGEYNRIMSSSSRIDGASPTASLGGSKVFPQTGRNNKFSTRESASRERLDSYEKPNVKSVVGAAPGKENCLVGHSKPPLTSKGGVSKGCVVSSNPNGAQITVPTSSGSKNRPSPGGYSNMSPGAEGRYAGNVVTMSGSFTNSQAEFGGRVGREKGSSIILQSNDKILKSSDQILASMSSEQFMAYHA